ncbi:unnamed protein product [Dibothriocephalus latus]|uniref:EGF-like domain-containing protein n=1 Tax=Dibothriocephalus latus TaxID=60516 RepID=A0A3P7L3C2_DIBLA|nr:unnamed protein product [Dibothriocephalus latus]
MSSSLVNSLCFLVHFYLNLTPTFPPSALISFSFNRKDPECYPPDDPCSESPCQNSGICVRAEGTTRGFVCQCPLFWWGDFCEKHISPCSLAEQMETRAREYSASTRNRSVCLNGGVCIDHPTKFDYFCKCPEGWTGDRCEQPVGHVSSGCAECEIVCNLLLF